MSRVSLNLPTPNFSLADFSGKVFSLADLRGQKNVLLVFNRTFV
jgi:peroxiredoxin